MKTHDQEAAARVLRDVIYESVSTEANWQETRAIHLRRLAAVESALAKAGLEIRRKEEK